MAAVAVIALVAGALGVAAASSAVEQAGQGRIVGGTPVQSAVKYPFMTSLQVGFAPTPRQGHFCGGSLIDDNHVLTAAHCVDFIGNGPNELRQADVRVVVGTSVLNSNQGQPRRISSFRIHPRYSPNGGAFEFDAAVIRLDRPVTNIEPIRLPRVGSDALERPGSPATITGWGNTNLQPVIPTFPFIPIPGVTQDDFESNPDVFIPNRLREARVRVVSDAQCVDNYNGSPPAELFGTPDPIIPGVMICAENPAVDTCQGDSGGPMFVGQPGGTRRQIGITSFGFGCASAGFPGVYTQLSAPTIGNFVRAAAGIPRGR